MNHNQLDHLGEEFFSGMPKLTTLYLDYNKIKNIHVNAFKGLEGKANCTFKKKTFAKIFNF